MPFALLIGCGSGLASALLFYSAARGAPLLGTLLVVLTPLPSLLAGLGWGWLPATAGALAGAAAIAVVADPAFAIGYGLALGVPAAVVAYLVFLSRPRGGDGEPEESAREWYPPGRLVAALALYAGLLPVAILPLIGGSYAVLASPLEEFYRRLLANAGPELGISSFTAADIADLAALTIILLPGIFAAYWLAIFTLNLYLAGRILNASGHLSRDWPDLAATRLPVGLSLLLALALAAAFMPGVAAVAASSITGALLFAYLLAGLALLHYVARGRAPWILWLVYVSLIMLGPYAAFLITAGGLLDEPLKLRHRLGARLPSP
jgi:hypothetical protein